MSDLRPMLVSSDQQFAAVNPSEEAIPYSFSSLTAGTPLLLYFEIYHLAFTGRDQTEYDVDYEGKRD